jgi:hypothetical protein
MIYGVGRQRRYLPSWGNADLFVIPVQAGIQSFGLTGLPPARERQNRIYRL